MKLGKDWKFCHIAFVVKDLDQLIEYLERLAIGEIWPEVEVTDDSGGRSRVRHVIIGDTEIEFFQPVSGSSTLSDFLTKHGEGLHHISFKVADIDTTINNLVEKDVRLIAKKDLSGRKIAFLDINQIAGTLLELEQIDQA
jgi:methylmalonyl-CoA/ethylmalonyl-CoA epimerase